MASVTIDMGFGRRATLSKDGGSRQSLEHRSAVLELMLHWPKYMGLTTGAAGFLRELQLGLFNGDPVAALKSAIEDGRVSVSIDRAVPSIGGVADQPSTRPFSRPLRRASVPSVAALPIDKPLPDWATWSDVSADSLIDYLEGVVAKGTQPSLRNVPIRCSGMRVRSITLVGQRAMASNHWPPRPTTRTLRQRCSGTIARRSGRCCTC